MRAGDLISTDSAAELRISGSAADIDFAWQVLNDVPDPEVPAVSVVDLGIVREVFWQDEHLQVLSTPTYSGCPATEFIEEAVRDALLQAGFVNPQLTQKLDPAWTTDWITAEGREKLKAYGIAPPAASASKRSLLGEPVQVHCPQCGSEHTEQLSEFGSTACKALYRCNDCLEPFDYFKCI